MVLPGRNLAVLAQRPWMRRRPEPVLPETARGPEVEHSAFGVTAQERKPMFDEAIGVLRLLPRTAHAPRRTTDSTTLVVPADPPCPRVMGGMAPAELRRVGRLSDGWLASFCTPADIAEALPVIEAAAEQAGRSIDPEHIGAPIIYRRSGPLVGPLRHLVARRNPGLDPSDVVPAGLDGVVRQIEG
jgi:alkanesulfonate monooxygenase SsuD/methylene tetrahydromethanopterin reductase-like flavin-dependent oxidoreductase (luciferase family)